MLPKFQNENLQHNLRVLDIQVELALRKACTPAQLALAWLLAQNNRIVPIPGTRSIARLDENLGALDVHFSKADAYHTPTRFASFNLSKVM